MAPSSLTRPWCAVIQWPGLSPVTFGTAILPHDARLDEVEAEIVALAKSHVPGGFRIIDLRPGVLIFHPGDD